ncbi:MAG: hypothetical protein MUQ10_06275, partial [Anaerolineae bacterium]|nr:hypothetical protein [Anaerolineae bacterium]
WRAVEHQLRNVVLHPVGTRITGPDKSRLYFLDGRDTGGGVYLESGKLGSLSAIGALCRERIEGY